MSETKETRETKRTTGIAFRLTDEEYAQAESAAMAAGDDTNNWCRELALMQSSEGHELTRERAVKLLLLQTAGESSNGKSGWTLASRLTT